MFLLYYHTGIRVVVQTSNINDTDYTIKTQATWIQDFPLKCDDSNDNSSSEFGNDLTRYTKHIKINPTSVQPKYDHLVSLLELYDFSSAEVILIPSVPGIHRDDHWGHRKLSKHIKELRSINNNDDSNDDEKGIVIQISSIGSLKKDSQFIEELVTAMCGGYKTTIPVAVIWPTVEIVRDSIAGYRSGGSICGASKNITERRILDCYHNWQPVNSACTLTTPHIKSYLKYRRVQNDIVLDHFVIGSHNLSQAAWGSEQKNNTQLFIRSYEMSILFHPKKLKNNSRRFSLTPNHRLLGLTDANISSTDTQKLFLISQGIIIIIIISFIITTTIIIIITIIIIKNLVRLATSISVALFRMLFLDLNMIKQ